MTTLILLTLALLTGCASTGDLGTLQKQVNAVEKVAARERDDNVALRQQIAGFTEHIKTFEAKVHADVEAEKDRATMSQNLALTLQQKLEAQNVALIASQEALNAEREERELLEAEIGEARKEIEHMQTVVDVALLKVAKAEQDLTRMLAQVGHDRERLHAQFIASTNEMMTLAQALSRSSELQTAAIQAYLQKGKVAKK